MGHMRQSPNAPLFAMQSAKSASRGTKCHGVRDARPLQDLRSLRKILWQACEADLDHRPTMECISIAVGLPLQKQCF